MQQLEEQQRPWQTACSQPCKCTGATFGPLLLHDRPKPNQTSMGVHFASYHARIDKLSVLKTTFPEQLALTADGRPGAPLLISVVAFRGAVRSEPRYVVSGAPSLTGGTGFVSTLSLMSRFGELRRFVALVVVWWLGRGLMYDEEEGRGCSEGMN
jgi:hypothetical protein